MLFFIGLLILLNGGVLANYYQFVERFESVTEVSEKIEFSEVDNLLQLDVLMAMKQKLRHEIERQRALLTTCRVNYPHCFRFHTSHGLPPKPPPPSNYQLIKRVDLIPTRKKRHFDDFSLFRSAQPVKEGEPAKCLLGVQVSGRDPVQYNSRRLIVGDQVIEVPAGVQAYLEADDIYYCGKILRVDVLEMKTRCYFLKAYPLPIRTVIKLPLIDKPQTFKINIRPSKYTKDPLNRYCTSADGDARGAVIFYADHVTLDVERYNHLQKIIEELTAEYKDCENRLQAIRETNFNFFGSIEKEEF